MIQFDTTNFGLYDLKSLSLVIDAFCNLPQDLRSTSPELCGYNTGSGYVYIGLDCGICIGSAFGQDVDYIVTDSNDGQEWILDTLEEAIEKQEELDAADC